MNNTENTDFALAITKEQLAELPRVEYPGHIHIIDSTVQTIKAVSILKKYSLLGFDTESKPTFKKGTPIHVSLIQIATDDVCFLFRTRKIQDLTPLREIVDNPNIIKIGLSLHDDFNNLSHNYNFTPQGFVDLQKIVPLYKFANISLQKIYAILFEERISKSQQLSNWDAPELTDAQSSYAAIDAWACIRIYRKLMDANFKPELSKYKIDNIVELENQANS